ncbi:hypothetical protein [Microbulbifer sp. Q7]|uniref:hypothetical protein n=1 Tax=Microbulbifer sp. Q7 TaxID=1785091 RepID=UPI000833806A|nr:hypothetical protein [Microbulbifer sp. Q7]
MTDTSAHRTPTALKRAMLRWYLAGSWPYGLLACASALLVALAQHYWSLPSWALPTSLAAVTLAWVGDRHWRPSRTELCRKLDARYPALEDSSHLLLAPTTHLGAVAQLQQQRVETTLHQLAADGALRGFGPQPLRSPLVSAAGAVLGLLVFFAMEHRYHRAAHTDHRGDAAHAVTSSQTETALIHSAVTQIQPPAYTGLAPRQDSLELTAAENSRITWQISLNTPAVGLAMLAAEQTLAFIPRDDLPSRHWQLTRTMAQSDFYQLAVTPAGTARTRAEPTVLPELYNIDITADRAPAFTFDAPRDNVTLINVAQASGSPLLNVRVSVTDDFQVGETHLLLTLASGSGENVRFRNERIALEPHSGSGTRKHYRFAIPVDRYQIEPGDELYWHLEARDNRAPSANVAKSQHFILRWPQEEIFGVSDAEGMAIKILPEYFRSQRQLIIDTEALLAEQDTIPPQEFRARSGSLAYEQNLLRMRYGRFLGEEDSAMEHSDDTHKTPEQAHGADDHDEPHHDHQQHEKNDAHAHHDEHAEGGASTRAFGDATGVIAAAGHAHDTSEHATLFDPETKELLRSALNAMWSAWRSLSITEPRASLPHQHEALRYIKQVQQASRIYLQRVGFEAPPLDETRRLSGEHEPVTPPQVQRDRQQPERDHILAVLAQVQAGRQLEEDTAEGLRQLPSLRDDSTLQITLAKHLRRYRQQPDCSDCRQQLSAFLYALLPPPTAAPALPQNPAPSGSYMDWLRQSAEGTAL